MLGYILLYVLRVSIKHLAFTFPLYQIFKRFRQVRLLADGAINCIAEFGRMGGSKTHHRNPWNPAGFGRIDPNRSMWVEQVAICSVKLLDCGDRLFFIDTFLNKILTYSVLQFLA